jgi:hypothetical protein
LIPPGAARKKLVRRFEIGTETIIDHVDQPRQFDLLEAIFARADNGRCWNSSPVSSGTCD